MPDQNNALFFALLVGVLVFLVLAGFITLLIFLQRQKLRKMEAEKELLQAQFEQQRLQSQLEVEEYTRKHIARELHDNIGALSSLIKINLGLTISEGTPDRRNALLEESASLVRTLMMEIKQLAVSLNSDRLNDFSFLEMMKMEVARLQKIGLFREVTLLTNGEERALHPQKKIILYRICQEILHNILKHAKADGIGISINYSNNEIELKIEDNGVGFVPEEIDLTNSLNGSGLKNIKDRVGWLQGHLQLQSSPGSGTRYGIVLPNE